MAVTLNLGLPKKVVLSKDSLKLKLVMEELELVAEETKANTGLAIKLKQSGEWGSPEVYKKYGMKIGSGYNARAREILKRVSAALDKIDLNQPEPKIMNVYSRAYCGEHESDHVMCAEIDLTELQAIRSMIPDGIEVMVKCSQTDTLFWLKPYEWGMATLAFLGEDGDWVPDKKQGCIEPIFFGDMVDSLTEPDSNAEAMVKVAGQRLCISREAIWFEGYVYEQHSDSTSVDTQAISFADLEKWWEEHK